MEIVVSLRPVGSLRAGQPAGHHRNAPNGLSSSGAPDQATQLRSAWPEGSSAGRKRERERVVTRGDPPPDRLPDVVDAKRVHRCTSGQRARQRAGVARGFLIGTVPTPPDEGRGSLCRQTGKVGRRLPWVHVWEASKGLLQLVAWSRLSGRLYRLWSIDCMPSPSAGVGQPRMSGTAASGSARRCKRKRPSYPGPLDRGRSRAARCRRWYGGNGMA